jgi:ArsR family transcriptional regulator, arsenate/arsenite/antimonite-responsive transcriptional repressor
MPGAGAAAGCRESSSGALDNPGVRCYFVDRRIRHLPKLEGATNRVYRALADPTRRRILALLRDRPMTAGELASQFDLAWPTMSGHFAVLREANLVQADRTGSTITYRLNQTVLQEALMALMDALGVDPTERPA